ncbi:hypothetical protein LCGC14_0895840, partial [marine sediment metagenome]
MNCIAERVGIVIGAGPKMLRVFTKELLHL